MKMQIEFVDTTINMVKICSLSLGDTFLESGFDEVCMFLGRGANGEYEYLVLGECPEIANEIDPDLKVRPVRTKLLVEI